MWRVISRVMSRIMSRVMSRVMWQVDSKSESVSSVTSEVSAAKQKVLQCENTIRQLNSDISVSYMYLCTTSEYLLFVYYDEYYCYWHCLLFCAYNNHSIDVFFDTLYPSTICNICYIHYVQCTCYIHNVHVLYQYYYQLYTFTLLISLSRLFRCTILMLLDKSPA